MASFTTDIAREPVSRGRRRALPFSRTRLLISAVTLTILSSTPSYLLAGAGPSTHTVCPSGCDQTSIQTAILAADPGDTVLVQVDGEHTEGPIQVLKDITVQGLGWTKTFIQQAPTLEQADRAVFLIGLGAEVTIRDLVIWRGRDSLGGCLYNFDGDVLLQNVVVRTCSSVDGGGIHNRGSLLLHHVLVWDNEADRGGGIYNDGYLEAQTAWIRFNTTVFAGGGLLNAGTSDLEELEVSQNVAHVVGGGIYSTSGQLLLKRSTIDNNQVLPTSPGGIHWGGGIYNSAQTMDIFHTTISNNRADGAGGRGGGLHNVESGAMNLQGNTFFGNSAEEGGGVWTNASINWVNSTFSGNEALKDGGGIYVDDANVHLSSVTISENTADADGNGSGDGGGIFIGGNARSINSLIVGNHDLSPAALIWAPNCRGLLASDGYLMIGHTGYTEPGGASACNIGGFGSGNTIGIDEDLGPRTDNGGPTPTHALLPGSLAVDTGDPGGCLAPWGAPLNSDQRQFLRHNRCDRGAFELGAYGPDLIFFDGFETGSTSQWSDEVP